ncbi:NARF domain-containing protein [Acanthopleuribacter pedis]|uniref:Nucleotidyltransferase-Associated Rossmannoid Fold domain-containing protein n=1 Tax=Acanthopleuribacter pedis TaxID=442870 RepID=A0A8J7QAZ7_9BACT|nr:NARF domain-containing protein [Acanthopleuribacter pedis]MBO1320329.1 hypothetical protein [Acanthopleuribacter pedis]
MASKETFREELKETMRGEAETLYKVLDERDLQDTLVAETRILLLSSAETSATKAWLRRWGMTLADAQDTDSFLTTPTTQEYDLILFDQVEAATVNAIMAAQPRLYCVAYAPNTRLKLDYQDRINLANSPITLFTRILETARFRKVQIPQD